MCVCGKGRLKRTTKLLLKCRKSELNKITGNINITIKIYL